jgi:hypothetical protein
MSDILDCGHPKDAGQPANVVGKVVQGWQFVLDGERRICHACADTRVLECGHTPSPHEAFTTGYGTDADGKRHCFECCERRDREAIAAAKAGDRYTVYYNFPDQPSGGVYQRNFHVSTQRAHVTNWLGRTLGRIEHARVFGHNFGGRVVTMRVVMFDGSRWSGRASWDNGTCITLRKAKG